MIPEDDREALIRILEESYDNPSDESPETWPGWFGRVADAILNAGWRRGDTPMRHPGA